ENMLSGVYGRFQMHRTKSGRRCEQDDIHTAVNELLVSIQPDKLCVRGDFDFVRMLGFQIAQTRLQWLRESVRHCGKNDIVVSFQRLISSAGTTTSAADETDLQRV